MNLSAKLAFQIDKRVQLKGLGLYEAGAVRVVDESPKHISARVRGGRDYRVELLFERGELGYFCECPYNAEWGTCKHVWATVLDAERRGALSAANLATRIRFDPLYEEDLPQHGDDRPASFIAAPSAGPKYQIPPPKQIPAWEQHLEGIRGSMEYSRPQPVKWGKDFEVWYAIDVPGSRIAAGIVIDLLSRSRKKSGEWTVFKPFRPTVAQVGTLPDPTDREIIAMLPAEQEAYYQPSYYGGYSGVGRRKLPAFLAPKLLPQLSATGRLIKAELHHALEWDAGEPWKLWLDVHQDDRDQWKITGSLRRGSERMALSEPELLLESGILIAHQRIAPFDHAGAFAWIAELRRSNAIPFPDRDRDAVMARLLDYPALPPLDTDEALSFERREGEPKFGLRVKQARDWEGDHFDGWLLVNYADGWKELRQSGGGIWIPESRVYVSRNFAQENAAVARLQELGLKRFESGVYRLSAKTLARIVRELPQSGWHVEAEGKAFRPPGAARVNVQSGIDWFELHAEVEYDGFSASLPDLLAALRRGDNMVRLGDGSFGLLPEEWLERFAPLAGMGTSQEEHLRFRRNQAGLLDALLAAQPEVQVDEVFAQARERIRNFAGIAAPPQPEGFCGKLRHYQREGLGWMEFLREFGFGGCLADDMGVGKTAQVLAMLETRRAEGKGPSLVVAPRSLIFNWREEAARFTPRITVLDHTGITRDTAAIEGYNMVLTTYGTMLRDIGQLSEIPFDYVVLDEAQAIKNSLTASAKAVRLLRGSHRLALSGTPIENHLGELWSLFEFLNPGMLGEAKVLKVAGGLGRNPGEEARSLLAQALRPFILRRTKRQVARELPEKTEQTIFCELDAEQRKEYDELRRHYRDTLLERVKTQGLAKSKIHVLEALLRLRQAACHPGLLDKKRGGESSAKLDTLMAQLDEIREEGHKALVFSQFTSLLAIVRNKLDQQGVRYEYLDGATRDRQARVEAFQNDGGCDLFLISLKAGGLGLNLTAAEYVFLLDPLWNPAVEAQAVDRAHRIGQTRPVFAYRLIARGTVEEKVLELQKSKRDLADAILNADNSLIRDLKREDLELLLS